MTPRTGFLRFKDFMAGERFRMDDGCSMFDQSGITPDYPIFSTILPLDAQIVPVS
jgi:hypothetical protein